MLRVHAILWLGLLVAAFSTRGFAQGGVFSYQGRLLINGGPATGEYDMRFQIFDSSSGGVAVSGLLSVENITVQNGLFAQNLSLGTTPFNGSARWLQIQVRPGASTGAYTALSPRQQILPSPYAIYSGNSNTLDGLDSTAFLNATPPISVSANSPANPVLRSVNTTTTGTAAGIQGETASTAPDATGVLGRVNSTAAGLMSSAVRGINAGTGNSGVGVYGSHNGNGFGVYGFSPGGNGVYGGSDSGKGVGAYSTNGIASSAFSVFGTALQGISASGAGLIAGSTQGIGADVSSSTNTALRARSISVNGTEPTVLVEHAGKGQGISVQLTNAANVSRAINVTNSGLGAGIVSSTTAGNALWGIANNGSAAAVLGENATGEAIVGQSASNSAGAVVGRNDGNGYGVRGYNLGGGIGVFGQSGIGGGTGRAARFENVNSANSSNVAEIASNGSGFGLAVSASGATGKGISVATATGAEQNALFIASGRVAMAPQGSLTPTSGPIDNPIIRLTVAGPYTLKTTGITNGTTVWLINTTGAGQTITNVFGGALVIANSRAQQFIFYSNVSATEWIAVQ